jgi:hypothetical protein
MKKKKNVKKNMSVNYLGNALKEAIKEYYNMGPRSNRKLIPLHGTINEIIRKELKTYECHSLPAKEIKVKGRYYDKNVDVCIKKEDRVYGVVSVKFIMSNYSQNANNYFENLVGELYNLKSNGLVQWYILVIFDKVPYYDKKNDIRRIEKVSEDEFKRYSKLVDDKLLNCLSIITISNGELLKHPNKVEDISSIDFDEFEIKNIYPRTFDTSLKHFCSEIKNMI